MIVIRKAVPADAAPLARLEEQTFRDAFEATNAAQDLAMHCKAHYGEDIQRRELSDPQTDILVCENEGELIAFSHVRRGQTPACVTAARPVEIQRFYVAKEWHGRGLAHDLMTAALGIAQDHDADQVWLGVWEHNPRAIAFYRKWGFEEVGDHVFPLGTDPQRDLVMSRPSRRHAPV